MEPTPRLIANPLAQLVRGVMFMISIYMIIVGVLSFFFDTGIETQIAIFAVLIFGLLAIAMGSKFSHARKHDQGGGTRKLGGERLGGGGGRHGGGG